MDIYEENLNKSTQYYNNLKLAKTYKFKTFDPIEDLKNIKNFSMTITAKRRTGKSVFMKDILSKIYKWYSNAYVFSLTADLQPDMYDFVPPENVINVFNEELLNKIWNDQESNVMRMRQLGESDSNIPHVLIVFDDLISEPKVRTSEILKRFYVAGRHILLGQIFISQNFTSIPPVMRNNVDVAVAFYLDSEDNRVAFAKQYLSAKNKNVGLFIFNDITRIPYQSIICLNNITSQNPEDTVRTYIANLKAKKFMIKPKDFKQYNTHVEGVKGSGIFSGIKFYDH